MAAKQSNIRFIVADDIGWMQPSIHDRGWRRTTSTASGMKAQFSCALPPGHNRQPGRGRCCNPEPGLRHQRVQRWHQHWKRDGRGFDRKRIIPLLRRVARELVSGVSCFVSENSGIQLTTFELRRASR